MTSAEIAPAVALRDILITEELGRRRPRAVDTAAEQRAFRELVAVMADESADLYQWLADAAVRLCGAGSSGISILNDVPEGAFFSWDALAGRFEAFRGGRTPRDFSPCGTTLDRGAPQLFDRPARLFTYFESAQPAIVEGLVIPFSAVGGTQGTIWVVSHDEKRRFDNEDVRVMSDLADYCRAASDILVLRRRFVRN